MPSYHWRETAVVLIYSMGYTLSFMRMPGEGPCRAGQFLRPPRQIAGILAVFFL